MATSQSNHRFLLVAAFMVLASALTSFAQTKVGYVSTDVIRERFPEAQQAEQRIQTITNEWKTDIDNQQAEIKLLEEEIQKKRLIWSDEERKTKEELLAKKRQESEEFSRKKFSPGGEFDKLVRETYKPIEEKIAAAIQGVARAEGYDMVWDKNRQPLIYVNPRYDITIKVMERLEIPVDDLRAQYEKLLESAPEETRDKPERRRRIRRAPDERQQEEERQEQEAPFREEKQNSEGNPR